MNDTILDCETTGLDPVTDRIVEIAAIRWDGAKFRHVINPERPIPKDATRIHGIKDEDVNDKPTFADIAAEFLAFVGTDRLVAHNSDFDVSFINSELVRAGMAKLVNGVVDTLALANKKFPNGRNTLDALCNKFDISKKRRKLHGALLDCELLKEVYDRLLHGDLQGGFDLVTPAQLAARAGVEPPDYSNRPPRKSLLSGEEYSAWTAFVPKIKEPIWLTEFYRKRKAAA